MNRVLAIRKIRRKMAAGKASIGSWMQIPHGSIAEILGAAGYDWVAVDMEHGAIGAEQLPDLFRALELGNTLPLVRVAEGTAKDCKLALDAGAGGVIVPNVQSADQLTAIRDICRWPPVGKRGVGFCRANLFGKNFQAYQHEAQQAVLVAMIENNSAIGNLDSILKVKGLDAILIGPYDLSASIGIPGKIKDSRMQNTCRLILAKSKRAGIACGIHVVEPEREELMKTILQGYLFIPYSIDAVTLRNSSFCPREC